MKRFRFPGVFPFDASQEDLFYGREPDTDELYTQIMSHKTLTLHATSGTGKSSLINAALLPEINKPNSEYLPLVIRFEGVKKRQDKNIDLDANISTLIDQIIIQIKEVVTEIPDIPYLLNKNNDLWYWAKVLQKSEQSFLFIFDQFENIESYRYDQIQFFKEKLSQIFSANIPKEHNANFLRTSPAFAGNVDFLKDEAKRAQYNLDAAFIKRHLDTKAIFVVREDKLGTLTVLSDNFPDILKNEYHLLPLSRANAYDAINLPAQKEGDFHSLPFEFEPSAINFLLDNLQADNTNRIDPIEIQIICSHVERKVIKDTAEEKQTPDPVTNRIKIATEYLPPINDIVANFYTDCWNNAKLTSEMSDAVFVASQKEIILELVVNGKRIPVFIDNFSVNSISILNNLIKYGLIRKTLIEGDTFFQLCHDRFIAPLVENLKIFNAKEEAEKDLKLYNDTLYHLEFELRLSKNEMKDVHVFIEEHLLSNNARTAVHYEQAVDTFKISTKILDYLIDKKLLNAINEMDEPVLEIANDNLIEPITNTYKLRKAEEEKTDKETQLENQQLRIQNNKKRIKRNIKLAAATILTIIVVCVGMYVRDIRYKNKMITEMAMFFKGNQYMEKGDLQNAFGIYLHLLNGNNKTVNKQMDKLQLDYTDIPGKTIIALSNNHILSEINDSTYQIWNINSKDSMSLSKTYNNVQLSAFSTNATYCAIYYNRTLVLYNSATGKDTVLFKNPYENQTPYFAFSGYADYFSYYCNNKGFTIDLSDKYKAIKYGWEEYYKSYMKNILFITNENVFNYNDGYIVGWKFNSDSSHMDIKKSLNLDGVKWNYTGNDTIICATKNGLGLINIQTHSYILLAPGDFSDFEKISKPSSDLVFLYTSEYSLKDKRSNYTSFAFYNLKERKLYEPFKKPMLSRMAVNADYFKCLIADSSKNIYLIDNHKLSTDSLPFLKNAVAYDISDNGAYILYVKEKRTKIGQFNNRSMAKTKSSLYLYNIETKHEEFIDNIYLDPNETDSSSIYSKYFFRFSPNSEMITYTREKNDSTYFIVQNLSNKQIVYSSTQIKKSVDDGNKTDFTSSYIHVLSKSDKEGIVLLNGKPRNVKYFATFYKPMTDAEWNIELKKLNLEL